MINILFCGASGRMGKATYNLLKDYEDIKIICGIDKIKDAELPFPIYDNFNDIIESPDIIIDFSHHSLLPDILSFAVKKQIPAIICTTGHSLDEIAIMRDCASKIPIFYSRNMSIGINLLTELSKQAASILGIDYNIEIIEAHHNQKLDAPSGTALMIADSISESLDYDPNYVYDRHNVRKKRDPKEIGIHSIRAGTIVGEHSVIFGGPDEVLTISHSALSRSVFASGAVRAARFMINKSAGLYDMGDIVKSTRE